jgi:hypothetical protein
MPREQVATVAVYDFGPSPVNGDSLRWRVKRGTRLVGKVEVQGTDTDVTYTIQVSNDGSTWTATTVNDHGVVLTNVVVRAGGSHDFVLNLRQGRDLYLRLSSSGGRANLQLRGGQWLEELKV